MDSGSIVRKYLSALFVALLLTACGSGDSSAPSNKASDDSTHGADTGAPVHTHYVETGDLEALRKRGRLRILTPRRPEGLDLLPRGGLPQAGELDLAQGFAKSLGLKPEQVYVDGYEELIPALLAGKGDIIADNLTITNSRLKKIAFSVPVAYVREQVVTRADDNVKGLNDLNGRRVAVHASDSYAETIEHLRKRRSEIQIETVPEHVPSDAILEAVADGRYDLTVADSNLFDAVKTYRTDLKAAFNLGNVRSIGWGVRPDSVHLLEALNGYLGKRQLAGTGPADRKGDLDAIKKRKVLRVLTRNNAATYFLYRGELVGFDYELVKRFADQKGLRLEVIVPPNRSDLLTWLAEGKGDIVAASLTATENRLARGIAFSRAYNKVSELVVTRSDDNKLESIEDLRGRKVVVRRSSSYWDSLQAIKAEGIDFQIEAAPEDLETEEIINRVANGEYDLTVADSHIVNIERTWRDDIRAAFALGGTREHGWAVRQEDKNLLAAINRYFDKEYRGLFYNITYRKYFKSTKNINRFAEKRADRNPDGSLSPYDKLARRYARRYGFDWRMVVSQMYQESRFNPKAKSWVGALGLMQVMPRTARELELENLRDPETGLHAGVKYLNWLMERFEPDLAVADRTWFALASYNAGLGHVRDARRLAANMGWNSNKWFGNVERAMLLLSKKQYARAARYGYVRGEEPVKYVRQIRDRYQAYIALTKAI
jgi:membrane-bound lytic murein transglycosylase F